MSAHKFLGYPSGTRLLRTTLLLVVSMFWVGAEKSADHVWISADQPALDHAEPHLARHPMDQNQLLAASMVLEDEQLRVDLFESTDAGETWRRERLPGPTPLVTFDPWVAIAPDGRRALALIAPRDLDDRLFMDAWIYRSAGAGEPWYGPEFLGPGGGQGWDQEKLAWIGDGQDARLIVVADKTGPATPGVRRRGSVGLAISDDGGASFPPPRHMFTNNLMKSPGAPLVLNKETILIGVHEYLRARGGDWVGLLWSLRSDDRGQTFGERHLIAEGLGPGMSWLAMTPASEGPRRVFAVFQGADGDVRLATSDTNGDRWSDDRSLFSLPNRTPAALSAAVDGEGTLGILASAATERSDTRACHQVLWWSSQSPEDTAAQPEVIEGSASCLELPGDRSFLLPGRRTQAMATRYSRGGEYMGLVGLDSGFYAIWVQGNKGTLQLYGKKIPARYE